MMEDDEYEHDSVYESHIPYGNDINIKSECTDYDEEFEQYYEEEEPSNVPYSFRSSKTVTVDVMLAENNNAQSSIQTNCGKDITIPSVIYFINFSI